MIEYLLILLQCVGLGVLLHLYLRLRTRVTEIEANAVGSESPDLASSVGEMIAELRRTASEVSADLSAKTTELERLAGKADARIAQLRDLTPGPVDASALDGGHPLADDAVGEENLVESALERDLMPLDGQARSARELVLASIERAGRSPASSAVSSGSYVDEAESNRRGEVLRLASEGWNSLQIARQVRMGREEVDLLLGLYQASTERDLR